MNQGLEGCTVLERCGGAELFDYVTLENEELRVKILPELGGKIASIILKRDGVELLQQPLMPYALRTPGMLFEDADAGGVDECVPSVAASYLPSSDGPIAVPDHGDFWQIPCTYVREGNRVILEARGFSLPLFFRRIIHLEGKSIRLSYELENLSEGRVPYLWSAHPAFAADAGDRIVLPASVESVIVEESNRLSLERPERKHAWPWTTDNLGCDTDLSLVLGQEGAIAEKIFTAAPAEGWAALERTQIQQRVVMRFDSEETPFLGMWLCYGGWPMEKPRQQQCVALEPCTAPVDALSDAMERGYARELAPHGRDTWQIAIEIHAMDGAEERKS